MYSTVALAHNAALTEHAHSHVYTLERSQHHVPEEALKHEKYTSHLHMGLKPPEGKRPDPPDGASDSSRSRQEKSDRRAATETSVSRPTPLYGQPSWWGEDDAGNKSRHGEGRRPDEGRPESPKEGSALDSEMGGPLSDYRASQGKSIYSYGREPSYFEIPTKEVQARPASPDTEVQEIPTKDTDARPPSSLAHARPDHAHSPRHAEPRLLHHRVRRLQAGQDQDQGSRDQVLSRQHKPPGRLQATTPTEVMSAESKVADWLVHSDMSMMRKRMPCEDVCSTKSDLAMNIKTLKGHHHDDGTQSDSEDPVLKGKRSKSQQTESLGKPPRPSSTPSRPSSSSFDDNPRKKRSQSFTHTSAHAHAVTYSALKAKLERRKGAAPTAPGQIPPTQQVTVPLKGQGHGGPQRASSLHREKADERAESSGVTVKPFGSLGKNSKLSREFAAEFLKETSLAPAPLGVARSVDPKTSKAVRGEEEDSLSDAGTYTIETESQDKEVEEARNMIDQVFGVLDSPEYTGVSAATYRPVIKERDNRGSPRHGKLGPLDPKAAAAAAAQGFNASVLSGAPTGPLQVEPPAQLLLGAPARALQGPPGRGEGAGPLRQLEAGDSLPVQEDLEPDSLSDTSRSEDVPGARRRGRSRELLTEGGAEQEGRGLQDGAEEGAAPGVRSTSFYIGSEQGFPRRELARSPVLCPPEREQDVPHKIPPAPAPVPVPSSHPVAHDPRKLVKSNVSAPNLQSRDRDPAPAKEPFIIRQESFTKDRPSNDVQLNRLPHISSHPGLMDLDPWGPDGDTIPPLPRVPGRGSRQGHDDSLSGDSDVDTASTISLVSSKNAAPAAAPPRKRPPAAAGSQKDKSTSGPSAREQARQPTARERLSEKRRSQAARPRCRRAARPTRAALPAAPPQPGTAARWTFRTTSRAGRRPPLPPPPPPPPPTTSRAPGPAPALKPAAPLQKDDGGKAAKNAIQQALIRSNSLSPRGPPGPPCCAAPGWATPRTTRAATRTAPPRARTRARRGSRRPTGGSCRGWTCWPCRARGAAPSPPQRTRARRGEGRRLRPEARARRARAQAGPRGASAHHPSPLQQCQIPQRSQ
ncbi:hypothetical protein ANANG_G00120150 [Anguilla anguilla]|uniref:CEP170 C-terminal domain-containing protein n=1 Tax=Anguilla anguilla TaxID=7936 RepID=A0A9D3S1J0_ANGAN|nr:hypothetical protein ANANG_G00120150 [Anguilla anguilla]